MLFELLYFLEGGLWRRRFFVLVKQYCSTAGQNVIQMGSDKFLPEFWKIDNNFELARYNLMKVVAFRIKTMRIEILKARGPGKICSSRMRCTKVGEMHQISGLQMYMLALL